MCAASLVGVMPYANGGGTYNAFVYSRNVYDFTQAIVQRPLSASIHGLSSYKVAASPKVCCPIHATPNALFTTTSCPWTEDREIQRHVLCRTLNLNFQIEKLPGGLFGPSLAGAMRRGLGGITCVGVAPGRV